jgi:PKD repeat protein
MSYTVNSESQLDAAFIFPNDTVFYPNPISPLNYSLYSSSWWWDFGDQSGTATDANPFYFYAAPGTYTVTLVAYDSMCSDTAWGTIVLLNNIGMPEYISNADMQLANTPQGADLLVHNSAASVLEVQIYTTSGQLVYASQEAVSDGVIHLNMMSFANGNYLIRVVDDGKLWNGKMYWRQ